MLSDLVVASYRGMVRAPLRAHGGRVDSFVVLSEQAALGSFSARLAAAYSPVAVRLISASHHPLKCRLARVTGHSWGISAGILQWVSVSTCFEMIAEEERKRGATYAWVLRMRTDMVLFAPLRLPHLADAVYVPGGGMTRRGQLRYSNDHLFLCPRHLCAPYATLIRNFNDSDCRPLPGYAAGGDGVLPDGTIRAQPHRFAFAWHLTRAYNGTDNQTAPDRFRYGRDSTCGRIREVGVLYSITRSDPASPDQGGIMCDHNLHIMWRAPFDIHKDLKKCAFHECLRLSSRFSGGKAFATNTSLMYEFERRVISKESAKRYHTFVEPKG